MPKVKRNLKNKQNHKGGCNPQVDTTRYTHACGSNNQLPLDGLFFKHFPQSGGSIRAGSEVRTYNGGQTGGNRKLKYNQRGKGFSVLPDVNIGNRAEIKGYQDWAPPVITTKGMLFSDNLKPLCGQQIGGKNKKSKSNLKMMHNNTKNHSKSKSKRNSKSNSKRNSKSKSKRNSKSKSKKSLKSKKSHQTHRKQRGGIIKGMSGVNSNFSGDMSTRTFGCRQPQWGTNCV